jgi:hypothetical protein
LIPPRSGTCSSQAACLLAVGSAPLTDFRRLPRDSASTSRLSSSRRSLASFRFDPALRRASPPQVASSGFAARSVPAFTFRFVGSTHDVVASVFAERWPCAIVFGVSHRSGRASPSLAHRPTRGSKPFAALRWR